VAELTAKHYHADFLVHPDFGFTGSVHAPPTIRYVLVVKPNVKYLTPAMSAVDGFLSRFATSPASLAWEKIPFSFMVDWFVDLRGVLRKIDEAVGFTPYEIVSFTRSFSYHLESSWQAKIYSPCNGSVIQLFPKGTIEFKHYDRSMASGDSKVVWKPRFGKSQAAITAALIAQMLNNTNWTRNVARRLGSS
jgi:hypothetical protein